MAVDCHGKPAPGPEFKGAPSAAEIEADCRNECCCKHFGFQARLLETAIFPHYGNCVFIRIVMRIFESLYAL